MVLLDVLNFIQRFELGVASRADVEIIQIIYVRIIQELIFVVDLISVFHGGFPLS